MHLYLEQSIDQTSAESHSHGPFIHFLMKRRKPLSPKKEQPDTIMAEINLWLVFLSCGLQTHMLSVGEITCPRSYSRLVTKHGLA